MQEQVLLQIIVEKYKRKPLFSEIAELEQLQSLIKLRLEVYGQQYYKNDRPKLEAEINSAIKFLILLEATHGFHSDDFLRTIKDFMIISYHQKEHKLKITNYLKNEIDNKYMHHEAALKACIYPIICYFGKPDFTVLESDNLYFKNKEIAENWIKNKTLETLIFKLSPESKAIDITKLKRLIDAYVANFIFCFTKLEPLKSIKQQEINDEIDELSMLINRKDKKLDDFEFLDLVENSKLVVFQTLKNSTYDLKTSIRNHWKGIFFNLEMEFYRKKKKQKKEDEYYLNGNFDFFDKYPEFPFVKEELLTFVANGLTKIANFMNGNSLILLLTAKRNDFTKIVLDTFNDYLKGEKPGELKYKKSVETTLRRKCKTKLIETLKEMAEKDNNHKRMLDFLMSHE